jgi:acyl dehydratase
MPTHPIRPVVFTELPSLRAAFFRAVLSRKGPPPPAAELPRLEAVLERWRPPAGLFDAYRRACESTARMPITWFQLVATRLHVVLLTSREFPVRAVGLVHPRVRLVQHHPVDPDAPTDVEVAIGSGRDVAGGIEFDLETRVRVGSTLVWESVAATFARTHESKRRAESPSVVESGDRAVPVRLPADAGRRYARVSGDANPIHLHPIGARLFGYRRPIGHGWWLLARTLAALALDEPRSPATVDAKFLRPAWLPSDAEARARTTRGETFFSLVDRADGKARIEGSVRAEATDSTPGS